MDREREGARDREIEAWLRVGREREGGRERGREREGGRERGRELI